MNLQKPTAAPFLVGPGFFRGGPPRTRMKAPVLSFGSWTDPASSRGSRSHLPTPSLLPPHRWLLSASEDFRFYSASGSLPRGAMHIPDDSFDSHPCMVLLATSSPGLPRDRPLALDLPSAMWATCMGPDHACPELPSTLLAHWAGPVPISCRRPSSPSAADHDSCELRDFANSRLLPYCSPRLRWPRTRSLRLPQVAPKLPSASYGPRPPHFASTCSSRPPAPELPIPMQAPRAGPILISMQAAEPPLGLDFFPRPRTALAQAPSTKLPQHSPRTSPSASDPFPSALAQAPSTKLPLASDFALGLGPVPLGLGTKRLNPPRPRTALASDQLSLGVGLSPRP